MSTTSSVSQWIDQLKAGEESAVQKLWERYCADVIKLARKKLPRLGGGDEEDVALSAFYSLCRGAQQLRFAQLSDRNDLWQLLFVITERKAIKLVRYERRQKRGGGKVQGEPEAGFDQLHGCEPTPEFVAQAAEQFQRLLDSLKDDELKSIAVWKMEGLTSAEIADQLQCVPRTVDRKLRLIRNIWSAEGRS